MTNSTTQNDVINISTSELHFDPDNPRFYRLNTHETEDDVIEDMLDDEGVADLMRSIAQKGYFQGEPILVVKEGSKYIVVEGNRRLAAVKLLNGEINPPLKRSTSVNQILENAVVTAPTNLPCIVYEERKDVLRYLGYRHITGIKEWDSLSKAIYLANIRDVFYSDKETSEQMRALSNDIGSRSDYVAQLLTALSLYNTAKGNDFFGLPMEAEDVVFSYVTTSLNYTNITDWLGLDSRKDIEQENLLTDNLESLFAWMFVKDQQGRTILGESRNLDKVAAVVANESAVHVLKKEGNLDTAYLYSDGPQEALVRAIQGAISGSERAWALLLDTENLTTSHLDLAEKLFNQARDLRNHLRDKLEDN